jgi:hypothetical protein
LFGDQAKQERGRKLPLPIRIRISTIGLVPIMIMFSILVVASVGFANGSDRGRGGEEATGKIGAHPDGR